MGVGNDPTYNNTRCFFTFPFPDASAEQRERIAACAEALERYRNQVLTQHPAVDTTKMYNLLEKHRAGEPLTAAEQRIHMKVAPLLLGRLHDELDAAVCEAYGWPADLSDAELLDRIALLNQQRAEEEAAGLVRWLRSDLAAESGEASQPNLPATKQQPEKAAWPSDPIDQFADVLLIVRSETGALDAKQVASRFVKAKVARVARILEQLADRRLILRDDDGRYRSVGTTTVQVG